MFHLCLIRRRPACRRSRAGRTASGGAARRRFAGNGGGLTVEARSLLAVGAAHVDRRCRVAAPHVPGASNPGSMREEIGGGAFNALRNAMRHGAAGAIISARGGDMAGESVAAAIEASGARDLSAIHLDRATPSYTAILDHDGELVTGFADMALYDAAFARHLRRIGPREAIAASGAVCCDANLPADAVSLVCGHAGERPVHAVAISPAKIVRLASALGRLATLFMNAAEARALAGAPADAVPAGLARMLRQRGLARAAISAGADAVTGFDEDGPFAIDFAAAAGVADVTGAGDALAGVTIAFLMRGLPFRQALRRGVAAARLTVATPAVLASYDDAAFEASLALVGTPRAVP